MRPTIRLFLLLEGASFVLAGLAHSGVLAHGDEHGSAATAESVIGAGLLVGLALAWGLIVAVRAPSRPAPAPTGP